jgi:hypothetical protein
MFAALLFLVALVATPYVDVIKVFDKTGQTPKITVLPQYTFSVSFLTKCLTRIRRARL